MRRQQIHRRKITRQRIHGPGLGHRPGVFNRGRRHWPKASKNIAQTRDASSKKTGLHGRGVRPHTCTSLADAEDPVRAGAATRPQKTDADTCKVERQINRRHCFWWPFPGHFGTKVPGKRSPEKLPAMCCQLRFGNEGGGRAACKVLGVGLHMRTMLSETPLSLDSCSFSDRLRIHGAPAAGSSLDPAGQVRPARPSRAQQPHPPNSPTKFTVTNPPTPSFPKHEKRHETGNENAKNKHQIVKRTKK